MILEWMRKPEDELTESERMFTDLIKKAIGAPEAAQLETIESIRDTVLQLENLAENLRPDEQSMSSQ